ncbi:MAG: hypothetical protein IKF59_04435 [Lachnospiraceae bacterium]|nr:hypothetical protein [Eubacterium sp.]MBR3187270.1 hypothetical protein [Lachnospiraceae bacterium]
MFDKYGEFDSVEELNLAAEGFASEGDMESLRGLARENGIDEEEAEDYMAGEKEDFVTPYEAAIGRLKVQEGDAPQVLLTICAGLCADREDLCHAVMKKGRRVREAFEALKSSARKEARARINRGETMASVCETDREKETLIIGYFLHSGEEFDRELEAMIKGGVYESV